MKRSYLPALVIALVLGVGVALIDTSPNWDDTGISVFLILGAGFISGYLTLQKPWLIALAVSIWIPVFNVVLTQNYGSFLALAPGFIGVLAGYYLRRGLRGY